MRDNHAGLPEIISAYERDGYYFGVVSITIADVTKRYEFGIDQTSYQAIARLFDLRPFDRMPGIKYHYYFSPKAGRKDDSSTYHCAVRIEQENRGKEFEIEAPKTLIANLMWFFQVKDWKELSQLREIH
jgi:hypothetical protein